MSSARKRVLELIENSPRPLSAREIFNAFVTQSCSTSLPTVYRAIQELERRELLVRDWSDGGRELVFRLKTDDRGKTGPRIRCRLCLRSWPLEAPGLAAGVAESLAGLTLAGTEAAFTVQIDCAQCVPTPTAPPGASPGFSGP